MQMKKNLLCLLILAKKVSAVERQLRKEEEILESVAEKKALMGVSELAKGIQYSEPIKTRWIIFRFSYCIVRSKKEPQIYFHLFNM